MDLQILEIELFNSVFILIISIVVAWLTQYFFGHIVNKFTKRTRTKLDDLILKILQRPIYYSVLLAGVYISLNSLTINPYFQTITKNILFTVGFIVWTYAIGSVAGLLLEDYKDKMGLDRKAKIDSDMVPFIENLVKAALIGIGVLMILDLWGVDITPLLASAGVAGVALAFAAKDSVSNLFGGISIFMDRPYRVGDFVILDEHYRGEVKEIGMRSTKLLTRDNVLITVPNAVMVTQNVVNETGIDPVIRIRIPIGVDYKSDLEQVEYVLKSVAQEHDKVLQEPHPRVRFRSFADSGIQLELLVFINAPINKGRVTHELIKSIKAAFDQEHIIIPYPHREVLITHRN